MKRMLINATQPEELRVAIVDGQNLFDLDIETASREQKKSNIYKGKITRIEPSLEAAFVDYGAERHGFLPLKEISKTYFKEGSFSGSGKPNIKEVLKEGQEIVVQVDKEERGNKGAALTTFISLAGRYLVLMPNNPKAGGVSRRIEGDERREIKRILNELNVPSEMGLIVRTAGMGRDLDELQWDLDYLQQLWKAIMEAVESRPAPFLIYQESSLIIRALRDYLRADIGEILIDSEEIYTNAQEFMQHVMPHNLRKLKFYQDDTPLFSRYQIESQIESAFSREVRLPSGGSIVMDHTEALISIDINSARATKGTNIEDTALQTNLEAADEIARQLKIRDLGGLVVIDFIDMYDHKNQRAVEERIKEALKLDRARIQTSKISRFGLLEMSRQRLRPSLGESSQIICPRCTGHGTIRSVESLALSILRLLEEESMKEFTGQVIARVPTAVANFLLNEKRTALTDIEKRHKIPLLVVADYLLETPAFEIRRVRVSETGDFQEASYQLQGSPVNPVDELDNIQETQPVKKEQPAVNRIVPKRPAPERAQEQEQEQDKAETGSFLSGIFKFLFSSSEETNKDQSEDRPNQRPSRSNRSDQRNPQNRRSRNNRNRNQSNRSGGQSPKQAKQTGSNAKNQSKPNNETTDQSAQNKRGKSSPPQKKTSQAKPAQSDSAPNDNKNRNKRRGTRGGKSRKPQDGNLKTQQDNKVDQTTNTDQSKTETSTSQTTKQGTQSKPAPRGSSKARPNPKTDQKNQPSSNSQPVKASGETDAAKPGNLSESSSKTEARKAIENPVETPNKTVKKVHSSKTNDVPPSETREAKPPKKPDSSTQSAGTAESSVEKTEPKTEKAPVKKPKPKATGPKAEAKTTDQPKNNAKENQSKSVAAESKPDSNSKPDSSDQKPSKPTTPKASSKDTKAKAKAESKTELDEQKKTSSKTDKTEVKPKQAKSVSEPTERAVEVPDAPKGLYRLTSSDQ